ncbi:restriction endonuclease subunit S [Mediterraneibacter massiliensis]|uniref:restriction endonuclease subunit S n=1 Tax=Mediterraneibacter massiliensis TaxID=1720300 RepID=UPI0024ACEA62|nr:restriction endonuclease subunit S [Mediterraneibacter massiliensis]
MSWDKKKLETIIQFKNGKKRPNSSGTIPVYGGNGILGYTNESNYKDCIIVGRVGAYCGSVYYEPFECWISDNAIAGQPKNDTDISYAYYLLSSLQLNRRHIGTGQPLLTQSILNGIECLIPDIETQKKISGFLGTIDQKIYLNEEVNKNLVA